MLEYVTFHSTIQERNWQSSEGSSRGYRTGVPLENESATAEPGVPAGEPGVPLENQGCHHCTTRSACLRTRVSLEDHGCHCRTEVPQQNGGASAEWGCLCRMGLALQNRKCCYRMGAPLKNRGACGRLDNNILLDLGFKSVWNDL